MNGYLTDLKKVHYVELPSSNLSATKTFFTTVFGWSFKDFGEEYSAFTSDGGSGGFYQSDLCSETAKGAALVVLYHDNLETVLKQVTTHGGKISKEIFAFPGGRRFHFTEPSGNEFAVWSDH